MKKEILKPVILVVFVLLILLATVIEASNALADNDEPTISEVYIPSETVSIKQETTTIDTEIVVVETTETTTIEETTIAEETTTTETTIITTTEETTTESKAEVNEEKYPVMRQVWNYMKNEFGWNDIVCAGIIGNLTAECGGCWTADLNWSINTGHGIGMVQWIGGRRTQLVQRYGENPTVEEQLQFMYDELYGLNGATRQVSDWQLDQIMNAETPEDCAFAFASYYERCAQQYRYPRRGYARTAYEYFVG